MLTIEDIEDAIVSHALSLGVADTVTAYAPDQIPISGVHIWVEFTGIGPARRTSGLASTSSVLVYAVTVVAPLEADPGLASRQVLRAADQLMRAYISDFTLGGLVRAVDVRGSDPGGGGGDGLSARAGYPSVNGVLMRAVTINLPLIVNDLWDETP